MSPSPKSVPAQSIDVGGPRSPRVPARRYRARRAAARRVAILLVAGIALSGLALHAQTENKALVELVQILRKNGQITAEQSELILKAAREGATQNSTAPVAPTTVPVAREKAAVAPVFATPKEKGITRLVLSGLVHPEWDYLATEVSNGPQPATRNTFSMRRLKLALAGEITPQWSGLIESDFAATNTLEQAYVAYKGISDTEIAFGHTKVPFLREEQLSDSVFKGVERSASHRAFVEQSGRGFGAKNTGMHFKTKMANGLNWAAAVTNSGAKNYAGAAGNVSNELAYYAHFGYAGPVAAGRFECGIQGAYLPDLLPAGPITATAGHVLYEDSHLSFLTEYVTGWFANPGGAVRQTGYTIEPSFKLTREWELVLRYSAVDSNGLGLAPGSLIRNAPATGNFDRLDSVYIGGNHYFVGNAVKLTFGYEHAKATGRITGTAEENEIDGFRSRFQFLF